MTIKTRVAFLGYLFSFAIIFSNNNKITSQ